MRLTVVHAKFNSRSVQSGVVNPSADRRVPLMSGVVSRSVVVALSLVALLLGSGCTIMPRLSVGVDAIDSGQSVQDVRYLLKPAVKGVDESDLHFLEYSQHIDSALQKRGMTKAVSAEQANVEVLVNYGHKHFQRAIRRHALLDDPFFRERRCWRWKNGRCLHWRHYDRYDWWYDRPRHHVDVVSSYRVFLALEARLIDADKDQPALWTTRARAHFAKPDLRVTLPLLLLAAEEYIGVDTGRERTVVLSGDDMAAVSQED